MLLPPFGQEQVFINAADLLSVRNLRIHLRQKGEYQGFYNVIVFE